MELESSKLRKDLSVLTSFELISEIQNPMIVGQNLKNLKAEFHRRVKNRLFQYCLRLVRRNKFDDGLAKDLFQGTLLKALINIKNYAIYV